MIKKNDVSKPETSPQQIFSPPAHRSSILMIEDDLEIAADVLGHFHDLGYKIEHVTNGKDGLERVRTHPYDLVIVDRMLPELDGLSILVALRKDNNKIPVLVLSAMSDLDDRILGLESGGDDYLCKPFALTELAVRVGALLRRSTISRETVLRVGNLELDLIDREAMRNGCKIELLGQEFKLLEYMMRRPGQVLSRNMLMEDIWNYRFQTRNNLVDVHVGRLRRKIDMAGEPPLIHTISGIGFMLCSQT